MRIQDTTLKKGIMVLYAVVVVAIYLLVKLIYTNPNPMMAVLGGVGIGFCMMAIAAGTLVLLAEKDLEKKYKKIAEKYQPLGTDLNKYFTSKKPEYKGPRIGS